MHHRAVTNFLSVLSLLAGLYLFISQLLAATGAAYSGVLALPGEFFWASYSYLGFYIPLYLWIVAGMLFVRQLSKPLLFVLTLGALPLFTFALIIQLLTGAYGAAAQIIHGIFGTKMGASILLLTGAAELVAIYILTVHFFYDVPLFSQGKQKLLESPKEDSFFEEDIEPASQAGESLSEDRSAGRSEAPAESAEAALVSRGTKEEPYHEEESWERFGDPQEGISFPDIPELPELRVFNDTSEKAKKADEKAAPVEAEKDVGDAPSSERGAQAADDDPEPEPPEVLILEEEETLSELESEREEEEELEDLEEAEDEEQAPAEKAAVSGNNEESPGKNGRSGSNGGDTVDGKGEGRTIHPAPRFSYKNYTVPEDELLNEYPDRHYWVIDDETRQWAEVLKTTLEEFKISAEVTGIQKGPVITMFEILPAPGVKLSKIVNLADNIALRLAASRVRIVAPIPGKHAVGIEVPNKKRSLVSFKEMLQSDVFQESEMEIPVILGKDITGETQIVDLTQTPHLLIAGATGSGKSVSVNSIICSVLYTRSPDEVRMVLIDPKIVELKLYNDIPHLLTPVITEPKRAFQALQYLLYEMERRYSLLDALGVRDIQSYNKKIKRKKLATQPLPYIVVIVDEFADLMATSGKELESTLARLAAMSRAVGIHLVLATQRPSIDVITGLIKANIPSRIAFMVAGKFDSRIIIDAVGAEKLLGKGDMLFTSAWNPHPTRIQGAYLSEEEVEQVAEYVKTLGEPDYIDEEIFYDDDDEDWNLEMGSSGDPLMTKAVEVVSSAGKASASYLQRRLKIGYNRAARIVEEMEERGIVGPQNGSKPREILHIPDEFRES